MRRDNDGATCEGTPTPIPSPQGGGERTESAALVLAESSAVLGQKLHLSPAKSRLVMAKQRIGSPPGICYDSGAHLP